MSTSTKVLYYLKAFWQSVFISIKAFIIFYFVMTILGGAIFGMIGGGMEVFGFSGLLFFYAVMGMLIPLIIVLSVVRISGVGSRLIKQNRRLNVFVILCQ